MVDLSDKRSMECKQEMSSNCVSVSSSSLSSSDIRLKTCADCGTSKTPLWRGGPAGPKSLCNACGIKSRKRRALLGLSKASTEHKKPKKIYASKIIIKNNTKNENNDLQNSIKNKFFAFKVPMTWQKTKVRRKLGEEERAAMLLLALSRCSVYA